MLDQKTLEELKKKLLEEKAALEKELGSLADKESQGDYEAKFEDFGRDEDANAEEVESYATKVSITETFEKKLKDVNDALEKMKNGVYGICENCKNAEIPLERLQVYPSARTCLHCSGNK